VRRALSVVFGGAISKDTVSRVWRKVKADWDAWNARSLADEAIIRLILDGTGVRVRLDRRATSIVLLVVRPHDPAKPARYADNVRRLLDEPDELVTWARAALAAARRVAAKRERTAPRRKSKPQPKW
jgi:hypothetical protein